MRNGVASALTLIVIEVRGKAIPRESRAGKKETGEERKNAASVSRRAELVVGYPPRMEFSDGSCGVQWNSAGFMTVDYEETALGKRVPISRKRVVHFIYGKRV